MRVALEIQYFTEEDDMVAALIPCGGTAFETRRAVIQQCDPASAAPQFEAGEAVDPFLREAHRQAVLFAGENVDGEMDVRARLHSTSGGDSETELKLLAVTPTSLPAASTVVTIVTPVANAPSACRKRAESNFCCISRAS
jgi:hypothetical protein